MQHHFVPFLKLCSQTLLRLANLNVCVHLFSMQSCVLYFFCLFSSFSVILYAIFPWKTYSFYKDMATVTS